MNNQICYRMLYESGEVDVEELRKCYIDTYINPEYSEHKDLQKVVVDKGLLTSEKYESILTGFLNAPDKELVKLDQEPSKPEKDDIEKKIRETNAKMRAGTKVESNVKFTSDIANKKTVLKHYDSAEPGISGSNPSTVFNIPSQGSTLVKSKNLILGDCILKTRIGQGSIGQVWLAAHKKLGCDVAVKILNKKSAANKKMLKRFYVEGELSSNLNHHNIIHVYEFNEVAGFHFIVMQYIDGVTLQEFVTKYNATLMQKIFAVLQTLDGLYYAHSKDVIHRDIKLENLMIGTNGVVKITDFGFSKHIGSSNITVSGDVFGTPYYMPPEQWEDSRSTDQQADIYALGVCLYKMISGKYPIDGETPVNIFKKMMAGQRTKIRQYSPDIDFELEQIIETAIALRRENRFRTAMDFGHKLAEYAILKGWSDIIPSIFQEKKHTTSARKITATPRRKRSDVPKIENVKLVKNFEKTLMVHCEAQIDGTCLEKVEEFISPLARRDKIKYVIFDMSKVIKITSIGFATMLRMNEVLQLNNGCIFILKPTKQAAITLKMMSIDSIFKVYNKISELKTHLKS